METTTQMKKETVIDGRMVYQLPEFKALCERLGIAHDLPTTKIVLEIEMDKPLYVSHTYRAVIQQQEKLSIAGSQPLSKEEWVRRLMGGKWDAST